MLRLLFIFFFIVSFLDAKERTSLSLQLKWYDQFQFAGYYMAKEKGFYKEVNLDVNIKEYKKGINIIENVLKGKSDFSIGRENLILERSNGKKVVVLFALFKASPLVLISTKASNINSVNDFVNKRLMTTINDVNEVSLKSMIQSHNIDSSQISFLKHSHNINDLIDKKTDLISAYISKTPLVLKKRDVSFNIFDPKDYGFDMYSDFLFTSEKFVKENPTSANKFKEASLKGWMYAYSNIEETVDLIFEKYNSQNLSKEELLYEAIALKELSFFQNRTLGELRPEKVRRIYDLYNILGLSSKPIDYETFIYKNKKIEYLFTNEEKKFILKNRVKICTTKDWLPFEAYENNSYKGISSEYIAYLNKQIALDTKIVLTKSWKNSLSYLSQGKCDIVPMLSRNKIREKKYLFSNKINKSEFVLATKINKEFITDIKKLRNKKILVVNDLIFQEKIKDLPLGENIQYVSDVKEALNKLAEGKFYGVLGSIETMGYLIQKKYLGEIKISGHFDFSSDLYFAYNKKDKLLKSIIDKTFDLTNESQKTQIYNKWVSFEVKKFYDYELFFKIVIIIIILTIIVFYRSYILKKLNTELISRVDIEVDKSMKKNRLIFHQNKMVSMGEMIDNIAHQWRLPLAQINSLTFAMSMKIENEDIDKKFLLDRLYEIESINKYMSHTIDDFRSFVRKDTQKTDFTLALAIANSIKIFSGLLKSNNIKVNIKGDKSIKINAYQNELQQVFLILLSNSKDALVEREIEDKNINIEYFYEKSKIRILYWDNAGGIEPELIHNIFLAYFSTREEKGGSGLGLYIAKMIIEDSFHGKINVKNANNGLLFEIEI